MTETKILMTGIAFPNGMVVTPDNSTLIVAESYGKRLTAFDIARDGSLSNRRVWADLGVGVPDGICLDAENAIWYADVLNKRCVRLREGGEVLHENVFHGGNRVAWYCAYGQRAANGPDSYCRGGRLRHRPRTCSQSFVSV
jgi:sugar lactone lactonase YvrE